MDDFLEEQNKKQKKFILIFFLVSILFHLLLGFFLYILPKFAKGPQIAKEENQVVWVTPEMMPAQIADIEKPPVEKRPEKAKFVGQYDSSPKEEVVARPKPKPKVIQENPNSSDQPEKMAKASKPTKPSQEQKPVPEKKVAKEIPQETPKPEKQETPKEEKVAKKEKPAPEKSDIKPDNSIPKDLSDLSLKPEDVFKPSKTAKNDSSKASSAPPKDLSFRSAGSGLSMGRASSPDLFAHDYFPDYKIGGKTYLNVMKLQDVSYFVRMKRILKMRWNPVPSVERALMSNQISTGKIECVVGLALDPSGSIAELFIIRSSGFGSYDQEAIQTIRDSSPFSAPPEQFMKDGQLRMSWTFTVYL